MSKRHFIGLMSGTSADAVDAALVAFDDQKIELIDFINAPLPSHIAPQLQKLNQEHHIQLEQLCQLEVDLGQCFAQAAQTLISKHAHLSIEAIGSHGQTLYHNPKIGMSLQVGHPAYIAKYTQTPTVADFRIDDMALQGEGAPLAPSFHQVLFPQRPVFIVNIGGIANISLMSQERTLGWDTGPGNGLMDEVCQTYLNCDYDPDGKLAAQAQPNTHWLQDWLQTPYFNQPAPKSTGREFFNLTWLRSSLPADFDPIILVSSLNQLTVETIARQIEGHLTAQNTPCLVCGGGALNTTLMQRLQTRLPQLQVSSTAAFGYPPDAIEAMMCAWLAKQRLDQTPINLKATTGATRNTTLGGVWQP